MKGSWNIVKQYAPWLVLLLCIDGFASLLLWLADVRAFRAMTGVILLATVLMSAGALAAAGYRAFRREQAFLEFLNTPDVKHEEMLIKLKSSDCVYDMCFPSEYIIEQLIASDLLLPLDMDKIPNVKNIMQDKLEITDSFDPGNKYSLPYMWGTVGILYNTTMVEEPVTSWGILWDEKYAGQIWMYDSVRDSIGITLKYLGYDLNTRNADEIAQARELLIAQKPLRKGFGTDNMRPSIVNGKAAMAVLYSGDAFVCMDENEDLAYAVPEEGSNVWFDNVVIPKSAKNIEAAHAFINFLNDGAIAARNTEYIYYSTPNQAAMDRLDEYFTGSETYNPPKEVLDRCTVFHDLGDFVSVYNEAWNAIKMK